MRALRWMAGGILLAAVIVAGSVLLLAWSMGVHRFDDREVPVISVTPETRPLFAFTPDTAYQLMVYAGSEDGDGLGVLWSARGPGGGYANTLASPVRYGVPPEGSEGPSAAPLAPGQTYTVTVQRVDPKGGGDGFFNTRHRYDGKATFVVPAG